MNQEQYLGKLSTLKSWYSQGKITPKQYWTARSKLALKRDDIVEHIKNIFGDGEIKTTDSNK